MAKIAETERALRRVVREVYASRFGELAASEHRRGVPERERQSSRGPCGRAPGAEPLSIVDYLYLGQLPALLFAADVRQEARRALHRCTGSQQRLQAASARSRRSGTRSLMSARSIRPAPSCERRMRRRFKNAEKQSLLSTRRMSPTLDEDRSRQSKATCRLTPSRW